MIYSIKRLPDPSFGQYNIFRNGVYFAATDPRLLEYVDHNSFKMTL